MTFSFRLNLDSLKFLLGFNIFMFVVPTLLAALIFRFDSVSGYYLFLDLLGSLRPAQVLENLQFFRIVTSAFLHVDTFHLVANMIGLYQLGRIVKSFYGGRQLFSFYIITGIAGSILSMIFLGNIATVGASGAVFGLIGVLLGGSSKRDTYGIGLPFRPFDILPLVVYAFLIGLVPGIPVNNWAHLGGFIAGIILGRMFDHKLTVWQPQGLKQVERLAYYSSVAVFVISYIWMLASLPGAIAL